VSCCAPEESCWSRTSATNGELPGGRIEPGETPAEHKEIGLFDKHDIAALPMPDGYKRSIATWYAANPSAS
jgi:hypothetical protein